MYRTLVLPSQSEAKVVPAASGQSSPQFLCLLRASAVGTTSSCKVTTDNRNQWKWTTLVPIARRTSRSGDTMLNDDVRSSTKLIWSSTVQCRIMAQFVRIISILGIYEFRALSYLVRLSAWKFVWDLNMPLKVKCRWSWQARRRFILECIED